MKSPFVLTVGLAVLLVAGSAAAKTENPSAQIDALLAKLWKERGVKPNPIVQDDTFVRRAYLDVAGRIPSAEETRAFIADKSPDKRARLVDSLLDSEGYVNHYFNLWADILRINSQQGGGQNVVPGYIQFVKDSLRDNKPYDQFVRELITADNGDYASGATGYYYRDRGMPLDNMANTVRIFLGTRLECAQCHNHPFDKWTQMDFFHMAAFSYGVNVQNRNSGAMADIQRTIQNDKNLSNQEKSDLRRAFQEISRPLRNNPAFEFNGDRLPELPHDYKYDDAKPKQKIEPKTMFGGEAEIVSSGAKLDQYAAWMTSPENPRFTTVIANRLWKSAMGFGLIEPVDEFMDSTVATSPELMKFLEKEMIASGYDMKAFLRMIYKTQAYQREAVAADILDPAEFAFTGPMLRRMSAEQIWDSIVTLINPHPDAPDWKREVELKVRDANYQVLNAAIESKSGDELLADARRIADRQKEIQKELERLQKEQVEARQNKDNKKAQELSQKTNNLRNELTRTVYESVYRPAMKKVELASLELPAGMGELEMNPAMIDDNGRPTKLLRDQIEEADKKLVESQLDEMGITDERERRSVSGFLRSVNSTWTRAANLSSPAPAGHFLQQFGQSDRETIQNAESAASVPQALTMLNGNIFESVLNSSSVLSRSVKAAETPEAKIDTLFVSLLNRLPKAEERSLILADLETRGDKIYQDVTFALMNSQEFLFVK